MQGTTIGLPRTSLPNTQVVSPTYTSLFPTTAGTDLHQKDVGPVTLGPLSDGYTVEHQPGHLVDIEAVHQAT